MIYSWIVAGLIVGGFLIAKSEWGTIFNMENAAENPLTLSLRVGENGELVAVIRNNSSTEKVFLENSVLQPSYLVLKDAAGQTIKAEDDLAAMRFDSSIYQDYYVRLAPGEEKEFASSLRTHKKSGGVLSWGIYYFSNLAPGKYMAQVEWTSKKDYWKAKDSEESGIMENVWKGTLVSNVVEFDWTN